LNILLIIFFIYLFYFSTLGNIVDKLGNLMPHYFSNKIVDDSNTCVVNVVSPERHPLRWFLTRQLGCLFWRTGEIAADWYPLIRTNAVAKGQKSMWIIYITIAFFNLTKISLIILHFTLSPKMLYNADGEYDKKKVDLFYFKYWIIQLIIIYSSMIYEFSVYFVLKRNLSKITHIRSGFLKKFKAYSEYRIFISAIISVIFLPIISIAIVLKYFYYFQYSYHDLNFSFEEIKQSISNFQYYMIFIDQILLIKSSAESARQVNISTIDTSLYSFSNDKKDNEILNYKSNTNSSAPCLQCQDINKNISKTTEVSDINFQKNNLNNDIGVNDVDINDNNYDNNYNNNNNNINIHTNMNNNNNNDNNTDNINNVNHRENIKYELLTYTPKISFDYNPKYSSYSYNNNNNNNNDDDDDDNTNELDIINSSFIPEGNNLDYETADSNFSYKNKTLASYDDYNGIRNEWCYLRK